MTSARFCFCDVHDKTKRKLSQPNRQQTPISYRAVKQVWTSSCLLSLPLNPFPSSHSASLPQTAMALSQFRIKWNKGLASAKRLSYDSLQLLSIVLRSRGSSRDALVDQARQSNSAALAFLSAEREVGLLRYHGLTGYLREFGFFQRLSFLQPQQLSSTGTPSSHSDTSGSSSFSSTASGGTSNSTGRPTRPARVAFMITSQQKVELADELGYTSDEIKKLKPAEAAIILEHRVGPNERTTRLPHLMEEQEAEQARQRHEDTLPASHAVSDTVASPESTPSTLDTGTVATGTTDKGNNTGSNSDGQNLSLQSSESESGPEPSPTDTNTPKWFQVVETAQDGTETVHGLFKDREEAELCLDTKQHIRKKHDGDEAAKFDIRLLDE